MGLKAILSVLVKAIQKFDRWLAYLSATIMFLLMLLITYEVALRYLFNKGVIWAFDASELMLAAIVFLGIAWVMQIDGHVRVDFVVSRLGHRAHALNVFTMFLALAYTGFFVWRTGEHALLAFQGGWKTMSSVPLPLWPVMVLMPLGGFLLGMECIIKIAENVKAVRGVRNKPLQTFQPESQ